MKNNVKKVLVSLFLVILMTVSFSVTAFAVGNETFNGESMSGTIDYNYTVVEKDVHTDVSGVKLSWSVPVLNYTKTDVRTWNNETLKWEQSYDYANSADVFFTLANRGSYEVKASVNYEPFVAEASSVIYGKQDPDDENNTINTNDPVLDTIVNDDYSLKEETDKEKYIADNCTATISGTVTIPVDKANLLTSGSGKLGTYTVTISRPSQS